MIISEEVKIDLNQFNAHKYRRMGYDVEDRLFIMVKINHIGKSSSFKIKVRCDFCEKIKEIPYRNYSKNISKHNKYACSYKR